MFNSANSATVPQWNSSTVQQCKSETVQQYNITTVTVTPRPVVIICCSDQLRNHLSRLLSLSIKPLIQNGDNKIREN